MPFLQATKHASHTNSSVSGITIASTVRGGVMVTKIAWTVRTNLDVVSYHPALITIADTN